jgi:HD-like signal output (HDOD) protein
MREMSFIPLDEKEIRYQVSQITELPPLPLSLKRLIEIIHSEIDTPGELESIICYDPSIVAKVIMIANSTYYGCRCKVKAISKAITVIGADQVKSICICTLLMSLLSNGHVVSAAHREMLWKHAFACSKIAAEMTRKRPWMNVAEAAVLGIVHDLGWIVMATHFNEQFVAIFESAAKRNIPPWYVETQYGIAHSLLGKYLASRWAFPEEFEAVIEFHHSPERSKHFKTEVRLLHLVNVLSHLREYPELVNEESTLSQCRELYISEEEWEEYQERVERIWPEVDQLWNLLGQHPE